MMGQKVQLSEAVGLIFAGRQAPRGDGGGLDQPILGLKDVGSSLTPVDDLELASIPPGLDPNRTRLQVGDVVVTARTAKIRAVVVPATHQGVFVGPNLVVIRPTERLSAEVIAAYLRHPSIQNQLLAEFASRTPPGFSVNGISRLELVLPSRRQQRLLRELVIGAEVYAAAATEAAQLRLDTAYEVVTRRLVPGTQQ
jgi:hypothetical protein